MVDELYWQPCDKSEISLQHFLDPFSTLQTKLSDLPQNYTHKSNLKIMSMVPMISLFLLLKALVSLKTKHTRVALTTEGGRKVYFNDIRNFGTLKYASNLYELQDKLQKLGVDILCERYVKDPEEFVDLFSAAIKSKPKKTIAENIMNQNLVAGVGNYLKAEILYHAGVSPHRVCGDLQEHEVKALALFSQMIAWKSYQSGGATISTYRKENGEEGLYNRRFVVYNQKHELKGNEVIKETTKDKRTTHWVPAVQV